VRFENDCCEFLEIKDGSIVAIYCLDDHHFLGTDDHGHLRPTNSAAITLEHKFEVRKKGNRFENCSKVHSNF
jgi:hypothetical protein